MMLFPCSSIASSTFLNNDHFISDWHHYNHHSHHHDFISDWHHYNHHSRHHHHHFISDWHHYNHRTRHEEEDVLSSFVIYIHHFIHCDSDAVIIDYEDTIFLFVDCPFHGIVMRSLRFACAMLCPARQLLGCVAKHNTHTNKHKIHKNTNKHSHTSKETQNTT